ncbi:MAG: alkaline phosphatase [Halolamina sp.]
MDDDTNSSDRAGRTRRSVLRGAGGATTAGALSVLDGRDLATSVVPESRQATDVAGDQSASVFPNAVASGGPTDSGALLWTRIAPDAYDEHRPLGVEVAPTETFDTPVYRGQVSADRFGPSTDHTVTVDLDGELDADERYHYRFVYDGTASPTGRCRTLPTPGESVDDLRLAVMTCQDYQNGYYGAYSHVADEPVDFVVHLGDFIYESADGQYKAPGAPTYEGRELSLPSGNDLPYTLADFRYLHRTYRSDRFLQAAMREHTFIVGWDDHEVANNRYWDYEADAPGLPPYPAGDDPEFTTRLTADAIQAWVEYLPARVEYDPDAADLQEAFQLRRAFEFGDLATVVRTDERLFRNPPPETGNGDDPDRTMLGADQRRWLLDSLADTETTWSVWANEVLTMPFSVGDTGEDVYLNEDAWDGFRAEREFVMGELARRGVENFVTLTGDLHSYIAGYQLQEYGLDGESLLDSDNKVGVKLMTPAVTSVNLAEIAQASETLSQNEITETAVPSQNPHIEFFNSSDWGYSVVEFAADGAEYTAYSVDKTVDSPDATKTLVKSLRVPEGRVEIQETDVDV